MKSLISQPSVSALHEIYRWSLSRPEWQRDALRRIVTNGTLNDVDLKDLERLCRANHQANYKNEPMEKAVPLDKSHLPPDGDSEASVTLVSISNLLRVNRIPSDQILTFGASPGLTVIYGDNGSGKSGYARVIKKACRSRGAPPLIRPDVFATKSREPAKARIQIAEKKEPISWTDGTVSEAQLANIFVFDASTAANYLEEDGPTSFTPRGLDILPKLSKACDVIKERIQQEIDRINMEIEITFKNWRYSPGTKVADLVETLSSGTKPLKVEALAGLDKEELRRLQEINEALSSDPKQKAKATRASAERLKTFSSSIAKAAESLSEEALSTLRNILVGANTAAQAAKLFAANRFDSSFLTGTGGGLWRGLWEAARSFSAGAAYPGQEFPVTVKGAKCVLCQQDLDLEAGARLRAFEAFCVDKSQQLADEATKKVEKAKEDLKIIQALDPEAMKVESDLTATSEAQRIAIADFIGASDARLRTVKDNLMTGTWTDLNSLPSSPAKAVAALAGVLDQRAIMEESADDPVARALLKKEQDELSARKWLKDVSKEVLQQIDRYKRIAALETCQDDTTTTKITNKNTELTKQLVTDAFCTCFRDEAKALGLHTLEVKLEEIKGKKGETRFGVRLVGASESKVQDIASEGEYRCVALAAFLAELSQATHRSSLVFDDPVSSLDHQHCERIAIRLIEGSKIRQVIVFTHDAIFLNDLETEARKEQVSSTFRFLEWNGAIPGVCQEGLPWDWKSADDRFDKLEKQQRAIAKKWSPLPNEANMSSMRQAYSWLRATLERIIEKEVFADVVSRFRNYIDVKKLDRVIGFSSAECIELKRLIQKCHNVTEAHDPPSGRHAPVPSPGDLAEDLEDAKQLLNQIRTKRKTITGNIATI
ncbi:MAG: AAA family ATPase [Acidobacteriia bacterium]|nr:AAA family ATPase [Terriglobia bacterium]